MRSNAGKKDCALLWFTADFRGSMKVQAMTWAEQGMYRHLLDLAWEQGGITADENELASILRLTRKQFAKHWRRIGPCWQSHPEDQARLVNERMEGERKIRAAVNEKRAAAGKRGTGNAAEMARRGQAGAAARWQHNGSKGGSNDGSEEAAR